MDDDSSDGSDSTYSDGYSGSTDDIGNGGYTTGDSSLTSTLGSVLNTAISTAGQVATGAENVVLQKSLARAGLLTGTTTSAPIDSTTLLIVGALLVAAILLIK